jgi:TOMM system kinase/cyclase fusion protein
MTFAEILAHVIAVLQREGRISYRALQRRFDLDDAYLDDVKVELIEAKQLARDENGRILVWAEQADTTAPPTTAQEGPPGSVPGVQTPQEASAHVAPSVPEAERRQLTVLFCDLADSTRLARQLDPEDLRDVIRAYQATCVDIIQRFAGHVAQYLGDGLLVYFAYPQAHEDDAQRAVRAGLGMVEAMSQLNTRLEAERGVYLGVRLGCHTGLVVVGEVGGGARQEQLALGETPNLAARLQGIAAPNTLVISAATLPLLGGFFACQSLGTHLLKGFAQPLEVYQVLSESTARSRLEAAGGAGLTPLVGRDQEVGLLLERWAQVKDGVGQVVLLSGEAGIGKSRLVQVLTAQVASEPQAWLTPCQCSPYYQNSALYPLIDLLERVALRFEREESPEQRLRKLEGFVVQYGLPLAEAVPLFAALLSIPLGADYAPLAVSPEQQKQRTLHALLSILLRIAAQQPVLFVMEDLHWVDPTTLELLSLLVDQGPTARILALFTFRPDFSPPWTGRSHLTQVTLNRLPRRQAAELTGRVAHGKALPAEVVEQVVAKTDGVPLFVEELTKMVLESGLLEEREGRYALTGPLPPLAIPTTLHDSLMARLDRLAAVKGIAQLGAALGREFPYELVQAVSPWDEGTLQRGLHQLVAAEFLYQQGLPPQATYVFKHALIQDAAYQSLLKSKRQQYHQQIAQVLQERFPETTETQPELLAHHYTEAGLIAQAIPYWQQAGRRSVERSASMEAISHLTKALEWLRTLPDTPERAQHELTLQIALGVPLVAIEGWGAPRMGQAYARARELCQQLGDIPQLCSALVGLWEFYLARAEPRTARELGEQLLRLAQSVPDSSFLLEAHLALGNTLVWLGEVAPAHAHLAQGIALYNPQQHCSHVFLYGHDPGVWCRFFAAWALWDLGYPDQALTRSHEGLTLARGLSHVHILANALGYAARLHQLRGEVRATQECADAEMVLAREHGFRFLLAEATCFRGWALAEQGQEEEGIAQIRQGLAAWRAAGAEIGRTQYLALLAEAYGKAGQVEKGLTALTEALTILGESGERRWEAELYRLYGELSLHLGGADTGRAGDKHILSDASMPGVRVSSPEEAFQKAIEIARKQRARSLELRAAMSLSRLWQEQGKRAKAYERLAPIYSWFTEGFDTADLQEAKALLEELS